MDANGAKIPGETRRSTRKKVERKGAFPTNRCEGKETRVRRRAGLSGWLAGGRVHSVDWKNVGGSKRGPRLQTASLGNCLSRVAYPFVEWFHVRSKFVTFRWAGEGENWVNIRIERRARKRSWEGVEGSKTPMGKHSQQPTSV